jgi:hypothetical protein
MSKPVLVRGEQFGEWPNCYVRFEVVVNYVIPERTHTDVSGLLQKPIPMEEREKVDEQCVRR